MTHIANSLPLMLMPVNTKLMFEYLSGNPNDYGWLLTPSNTMTKRGIGGFRYGVDNECFNPKKFNPNRFRKALDRIKKAHGLQQCLFVVSPDVVANARATLDQFRQWSVEIKSMGFPIALAAQDGLETFDIPWNDLDCLFIGGSTEWKMSDIAAQFILEAKKRGKWTHVGRVNSFRRFDKLKVKPDSIDGTDILMRLKEKSKKWQSNVDTRKQQLKFDLDVPGWGE